VDRKGASSRRRRSRLPIDIADDAPSIFTDPLEDDVSGSPWAHVPQGIRRAT
jgi:hypothetical protein